MDTVEGLDAVRHRPVVSNFATKSPSPKPLQGTDGNDCTEN